MATITVSTPAGPDGRAKAVDLKVAEDETIVATDADKVPGAIVYTTDRRVFTVRLNADGEPSVRARKIDG